MLWFGGQRRSRDQLFRLGLHLLIFMRHQDGPLGRKLTLEGGEVFFIVDELIMVDVDVDVIKIVYVIRVLVALNSN